MIDKLQKTFSPDDTLYAKDMNLVTGKIDEIVESVNSGSSVGKVDPNSNGTGEIFNYYENNEATGDYSHAEGKNTTASGYGSHAEGFEREVGAAVVGAVPVFELPVQRKTDFFPGPGSLEARFPLEGLSGGVRHAEGELLSHRGARGKPNGGGSFHGGGNRGHDVRRPPGGMAVTSWATGCGLGVVVTAETGSPS